MKSVDWIEPQEAVFRLSATAGNDGAARDLIARALGTNRLSSTAQWIVEEPDRGDISLSLPEPSERFRKKTSLYMLHGARGRRQPLSSKFWGYIAHPDEERDDWISPLEPEERSDLQRWRWDLGLFVVLAPPLVPTVIPELKVPPLYGVRRRHIAHDVRLSRADIDDLLRTFGKVPPKPKSSTKYDFEPVLWELLEVASSSGLEAGLQAPPGFGCQAKIERWIQNRMDPNHSGVGPDDTWRKERAKKVADLMSRAKALKDFKKTSSKDPAS